MQTERSDSSAFGRKIKSTAADKTGVFGRFFWRLEEGLQQEPVVTNSKA